MNEEHLNFVRIINETKFVRANSEQELIKYSYITHYSWSRDFC